MFAADDLCSLSGTFQCAAVDGIKMEVSKIAGIVLCLPDTLVGEGRITAYEVFQIKFSLTVADKI